MQRKHQEVNDSGARKLLMVADVAFCEGRCPKATVRSRQEIGEVRLGGSSPFLLELAGWSEQK